MASPMVTMPEAVFRAVRSHLFPFFSQREQGGFLLCKVTASSESTPDFSVVEWLPMKRQDYVAQDIDYLELSDASRVRVIKSAHAADCALVEVHCHPGSQPACFSRFDMAGLYEFVPHIRWRLKGKPYGALVFAPSSVDGLVWAGTSKAAVPLTSIIVGSRPITTTGLTTKYFKGFQHG